MPASLLDSVNELIAPELLSASARRLGMSEDAAGAALKASFASILAGLAATAGNPLGMEAAFDIVNDPANDSPPQHGLGGRLLSNLFGPQRPAVGDLIGRSAGLPGGGGASVLSQAAPLVLGVLRRKITSAGLNPASLSRMLLAERDQILRAAPASVESLADGGRSMPEIRGVNRRVAARHTSPARLWHAVAAVLLAGVVVFLTREPQVDPEETGMAAGGIPFACGGRQVAVAQADEGAILTAGTQVFELRRTQTASGARYVDPGEPPATFFWDKGDLATVVVHGDTYPECRRVR
jgi:membrane-bound inhibitor of C-type lysozyme